MIYRITLIILLNVFTLFNVNAQSSQREFALKAGLIFNFALYSQTSDSLSVLADNTHYIICSSSKAFVEVAQKILAQKKVRHRKVKVTYVSPQMAKNICQIIFFNDNDTYASYLTSRSEETINAMLIGEMENFINLGGHINFIRISGKIRFEINPEQLQKSSIKVSSKVIRLGKIKKGNNL